MADENVNIDELAEKLIRDMSQYTDDNMLVESLHKLNNLLTSIYSGTFHGYLKVLEDYEASI